VRPTPTTIELASSPQQQKKKKKKIALTIKLIVQTLKLKFFSKKTKSSIESRKTACIGNNLPAILRHVRQKGTNFTVSMHYVRKGIYSDRHHLSKVTDIIYHVTDDYSKVTHLCTTKVTSISLSLSPMSTHR